MRISEIFLSIQGEGPYTGHAMIFVRLFGCNLTCSGFSNPNKLPIEQGGDDLPILGCDSSYSWHPAYKNQARTISNAELCAEIEDLLSGKALPVILCFTGGEPLLHQRDIVDFLNYTRCSNWYNAILFESNATVPLTEDMKEIVLFNLDHSRNVIFSYSPKLSNSGEDTRKTIRPQAISELCYSVPTPLLDVYFKFVSDGSTESFEEIRSSAEAYGYYGPVYVMPEGHTYEQQMEIQEEVANKCLEYGFIFSARVHCFVYKNRKGT